LVVVRPVMASGSNVVVRRAAGYKNGGRAYFNGWKPGYYGGPWLLPAAVSLYVGPGYYNNRHLPRGGFTMVRAVNYNTYPAYGYSAPALLLLLVLPLDGSSNPQCKTTSPTSRVNVARSARRAVYLWEPNKPARVERIYSTPNLTSKRLLCLLRHLDADGQGWSARLAVRGGVLRAKRHGFISRPAELVQPLSAVSHCSRDGFSLNFMRGRPTKVEIKPGPARLVVAVISPGEKQKEKARYIDFPRQPLS